MNLKSQLAPKGLEFKSNHFVVSDKYVTIMTVLSFPKYISPGYLSSLTNMSGIKVVIKHIPIPFSSISKMLNSQIAELKSKYAEENDKTIQERIKQDAESLEYFISLISSDQSRIFDFQMHVVVSADSFEEFERKKTQVKNYLMAMQLNAVSLRFEQENIFKSIIPIFDKSSIEDRVGTPVASPTIAAMYPFIFDSVKDEGLSLLLGVDFSGGVILFNQFLYQIKKEHNRNNANMIILGTSGSGKSTTAKLVLRSHIRNNFQIVSIDPEGEIADMAVTYGGDFIDLGKGGEYGMINPFEVIADADEDELKQGLGYTVLTKAFQHLKAFMKYYDPTMEESLLTMFIEVSQQTYKRFGIDYDTDYSKLTSEDYPTFRDVYATVKGRIAGDTGHSKEREILEQLELKIRPLTKELKYYFDGHTTISPKSNFIVFNIKELMNTDINVRNALFFNIVKYAWGLCLDKNQNTAFFVDEAHVLLSGNNRLGAEFLAQVQRRARKYNTGTIIITQQPSDFSDPEIITQGKAIFDNASYYIVMNLKKQASEDLSRLIDLNETEVEGIKRYNQGEALFVCGSKRMQIKVVVTDDELDSFGTGGGF